MKILYLISKYATVLGAYIKGLWEHIICGVLKIFVEDGRYLQPTELCGHVEHELTQSVGKTFSLGFFPFIVNAVLAFFLSGAGILGLFVIKPAVTTVIFWVYAVLLYLGISFFCNMFPLFEDAINNWSLIYQSKLSEDEIALNKELSEKLKAKKAYEKEAKKLAKEKAKEKKQNSNVVGYDHNKSEKKASYDPIKNSKESEKITIKKNVNIFTKIILFIPSAIMLAGSFLEQYGLTFILSVIGVIAAVLVS